MILEVAPLTIRSGQATAFEDAFREAQTILASMPGYHSHELQRSLDRPNEYVLLVRWRTREDHEVGFRQSPQYQVWKALLHHFYEPMPTVAHYAHVAGTPNGSPR